MAAGHYHTYRDPYPATLTHPYATTLERFEDWPKSYKTPRSNKYRRQGIHDASEPFAVPPGTVPNPAYAQWYSQQYGAQQPAQIGYWTNGQYAPYGYPTGTNYTSPYSYQPPAYSAYPQYPTHPAQYNQWATPWAGTLQPPYDPLDTLKRVLAAGSLAKEYSHRPYLGPGAYPGAYPGASFAGAGTWPWTAAADPATMAYQASQAAAANAALATMPQAPNYYVGGGPTDYYAQQAYLVANMGFAKPPVDQMAPFKPIDGTAFWCKELDGTFTMRKHADIAAGDLSPGHWERSPTSGYYWWVRDQF